MPAFPLMDPELSQPLGSASSESSPGVKLSVAAFFFEASTDCTARVWDPTFGDCLLTLQGHGADTWVIEGRKTDDSK